MLIWSKQVKIGNVKPRLGNVKPFSRSLVPLYDCIENPKRMLKKCLCQTIEVKLSKTNGNATNMRKIKPCFSSQQKMM